MKHSLKLSRMIYFNFNDTLRQVPRIKPPQNGPQIIFNSAKQAYRMAKYIYHIQAFKPGKFDAAAPYHDGKLTIIVHSKYSPLYSHPSSYRHDYNKHFVSCAVPFRQTSS